LSHRRRPGCAGSTAARGATGTSVREVQQERQPDMATSRAGRHAPRLRHF
jgi:hypothetical protein